MFVTYTLLTSIVMESPSVKCQDIRLLHSQAQWPRGCVSGLCLSACPSNSIISIFTAFGDFFRCWSLVSLDIVNPSQMILYLHWSIIYEFFFLPQVLEVTSRQTQATLQHPKATCIIPSPPLSLLIPSTLHRSWVGHVVFNVISGMKYLEMYK